MEITAFVKEETPGENIKGLTHVMTEDGNVGSSLPLGGGGAVVGMKLEVLQLIWKDYVSVMAWDQA